MGHDGCLGIVVQNQRGKAERHADPNIVRRRIHDAHHPQTVLDVHEPQGIGPPRLKREQGRRSITLDRETVEPPASGDARG
ncbi:hypothetical protein LTR94_026357, partial [Friedmanniomyces endolithicus]